MWMGYMGTPIDASDVLPSLRGLAGFRFRGVSHAEHTG